MRDKRSTVVAVSATAALLAGASAAVAASPPASLTGSGHGTWARMQSNPDTGKQYLLRGHGSFTIGAARIRGSVSAPGFIANGACSVRLRLVTATGSISLAGHTKSTSPPPSCVGKSYRFRFHTTKASGDLSGASYTGIGHFDIEDQSASVTDKGTFTLRLKPAS
jgi:hypothetical protein